MVFTIVLHNCIGINSEITLIKFPDEQDSSGSYLARYFLAHQDREFWLKFLFITSFSSSY